MWVYQLLVMFLNQRLTLIFKGQKPLISIDNRPTLDEQALTKLN